VCDQIFSPPPRQAILKQIHHVENGLENGEVIDEALITYFKAPHSFTGEDVVEISCHGSPVLLRQIMDLCLKLDGRMAEAGEFTLRALANGRMNLSQAEAVRDLIDAQTIASARQAVRQLRGELSNGLQPLKDALLDAIVVLESALEFVEDDLPEIQAENVRQKLAGVAEGVGLMADTFRAGKLLREGLKVALVGKPNVGKSSLFNALLGHDRAIVTEIAGTTRDQLHEKFTINNIPISLIDTAGLRETTDTVESIGVERSKRSMADADLVIVVLDGSEELTIEDKKILQSAEGQNRIILINKIDLVDIGKLKKFAGQLKINNCRSIGQDRRRFI
jgi:tRNA modification GTPase